LRKGIGFDFILGRIDSQIRGSPNLALEEMVLSKSSKESIIMHQIDLLEEYGIYITFNVMDLTSFVGSE